MPTLALKPTHKPVKDYAAAIEWVIDHYRVKPNMPSGIVSDPSRGNAPQ